MPRYENLLEIFRFCPKKKKVGKIQERRFTLFLGEMGAKKDTTWYKPYKSGEEL